MPPVLREIARFLPLTQPTTALRSVLGRGWDIGEGEVALGFMSVIIWIIVFLTTSLLVLKFKKG